MLWSQVFFNIFIISLGAYFFVDAYNNTNRQNKKMIARGKLSFTEEEIRRRTKLGQVMGLFIIIMGIFNVFFEFIRL